MPKDADPKEMKDQYKDMIARRDKKWDINPKPKMDFEARVIIWEYNAGKYVNDKYDIIDLFVTANF